MPGGASAGAALPGRGSPAAVGGDRSVFPVGQSPGHVGRFQGDQGQQVPLPGRPGLRPGRHPEGRAALRAVGAELAGSMEPPEKKKVLVLRIHSGQRIGWQVEMHAERSDSSDYRGWTSTLERGSRVLENFWASGKNRRRASRAHLPSPNGPVRGSALNHRRFEGSLDLPLSQDGRLAGVSSCTAMSGIAVPFFKNAISPTDA